MRDTRKTRQMVALAATAAILAIIGDMYLKPTLLGAVGARRGR